MPCGLGAATGDYVARFRRAFHGNRSARRTAESRRQFCRSPQRASRCFHDAVHQLPRARGLSGVPSSQCGGARRRLPSRWISRAASRLRVRTPGLLQQLPQCRFVLHQLSRARGTRCCGGVTSGLSRCPAILPRRAWAGGAAGPRILRELSCRARLLDLPLRIGRPAVRSAWARV